MVTVIGSFASIGVSQAVSGDQLTNAASANTARVSLFEARSTLPNVQQIRSTPNLVERLNWVKNDEQAFRSKSEVVQAMKRRHNAKVLKITLNEQRAVYRVRLLMPSGKIKDIQVSARR